MQPTAPDWISDLVQIATEHRFDTHLIGYMADREHRRRAAKILETGNPFRIVSTLIGDGEGGRVGGFIFNPYHPPTIEEVVRIKSLGGKPRHALFSVVCTPSTVEALVDPDRTGSLSYFRLFSKCFIRLPAKASAIHKYHLPPEIWSGRETHPYIQFFVPEIDSELEEIIASATKNLPFPLQAGTSSNYSGTESLHDRLQAASFCLRHNIFWLDHAPHSDPTKLGSYPIVAIESDSITLIRSGNTSFAALNESLERYPQKHIK